MYKMIQFKSYKPYNFIMNVNKKEIKIHLRYNSYMNKYYFNIDEKEDGVFVNKINSILLTTGVNLLLQHPQFDYGEMFIIPTKTELYNEDPKAETIQNYMLYTISDDE